MKKAVVVYLPPAKPNIVYVVMDKTTVEDIMQPIVTELLAKGVDAGKKIIMSDVRSSSTEFYYFTTWCSKFSEISSGRYVYKVQ